MFDYVLSDEARALRDEVRDYVRTVPRQHVLDMDAEKVDFPKEFLREAGRRNLMGCRYPRRWGGRALDWVAAATVMEEVGALGYMQVMGGIGYTNVFPVERIHRDLRLASIWTGTSEAMSMITASEWYREYAEARRAGLTRDPEPDAAEADAEDEKIYE